MSLYKLVDIYKDEADHCEFLSKTEVESRNEILRETGSRFRWERLSKNELGQVLGKLKRQEYKTR